MSGGVPAGELLPCPFCQSPGLSGETLDDGCYVSCMRDACKCMVGYFDTLSEAITAWNTRATPTPPIEGRDADVERVAEKIATQVADRCQGNRKPGQAPQRYAIIWQAARLGARAALQALGERG